MPMMPAQKGSQTRDLMMPAQKDSQTRGLLKHDGTLLRAQDVMLAVKSLYDDQLQPDVHLLMKRMGEHAV